ncbi:MAG: excinuclease ABC subunit UvrA [Deltaproteobacteria bacterium]|nr:excinuclease ABC subunit UvrA [Deltaproteobacteria bacterium]
MAKSQKPPSRTASAPDPLSVVNARENNLKSISLDIPHDEFTVVTGLSGSGKSSLAFDTVFAEGQRRYVETFSPYTRQFFDKVKKPNVDLIKNVRPAVAIQQRTRITNSRSTVGSVTTLIDYIKILWSNLAEAHCPVCGIAFENWTSDSLARHMLSLMRQKPSSTYLVCSRLKLQKISAKAELTRLSTLGFARIYDQKAEKVVRIEDLTADETGELKEIILVIDRIAANSASLVRLKESIEQAFSIAGGSCLFIQLHEGGNTNRQFLRITNDSQQVNIQAPRNRELEFSSTMSCAAQGITLEKPRPALFSFNHPAGACPECKGFGMVLAIDPVRCVPDPNLSIKEKALQCWSSEKAKGEYKRLINFCKSQKISVSTPWRDLPAEAKDKIFNHKSREYRGVMHWFKRLERKVYKMHVRVFLSRYRVQTTCPACNGTRLKPAALAFRIMGRTIADIFSMTVSELRKWVEELRAQSLSKAAAARDLDSLFGAVVTRLLYLENLGLPYLSLDRQARTLSGGETQRVNLATALGSELVSTQFVLDEPSVGLHSRDTSRLIKALNELQGRRNSMLVVEHDLECISAASNVIELGPKAGKEGGEVVFSGPASQWKGISFDPTKYLSKTTLPSPDKVLEIKNAGARNLKGFDLTLPLNRFVCITGVSGSGKSTLVSEVIKKGYEDFQLGIENSEQTNRVTGFENVGQLLVVDQAPLAKSPRSNIATYTDIWDEVRAMLAASDDAKLRGLNKSSFSFNVDGGRCPNCKGAGFVTEDMQFLSDVYLPCELCLGARFQQKVLEVRVNGHNVDELLKLSLDGAASVFTRSPKIVEACRILQQLGLGHLTLGHPLSELSGGEAQRLKLVPFLQKAGQAESLLIFDEPTTGLHLYDVERLIALLKSLRDRGHSVLCIEHNLPLIASCDWIIDLGPEGGEDGGMLVAEGSPRDLAGKDGKPGARSYTREALKAFLTDAGKKRMPAAAPKLRSKRDADDTALIVSGAKEHNLKNITFSVPLNTMVALSGVSGSGKSSIAKDIIYAEGQRRFLDCLSPYARQFIRELKRPEIAGIENLPPTICVYQHTFQPSRLSTVATMSEVYNYLRLLYAKTAVQHCPDHPEERISSQSPAEIAAEIKKLSVPNVRILAPVVKLKKGHHKAVLTRAIDSEFGEIRADGLFGPPSRFEGALNRNTAHSIEYVIGKFNPSNVDQALIESAVSQALAIGGGTLIVHHAHKEEVFSIERTCSVCKRGFFKPDPEDLSFNSRRGACQVCHGAGRDEHGRLCKGCGGARINALGRNLLIDGIPIHKAAAKSAPELKKFLQRATPDERRKKISEAVLAELLSRLDVLMSVGLDYLPLDRDCSTLSSGELQRLRLATAMGSPLTGVMYIFDEPSAGLHPLDNEPVLARLKELKERGNSVIVIEHDPASILACEYSIDVGPGGGSEGGEIVYSGPIKGLLDSDISVTGQYLRRNLASARELAVTSNGSSAASENALTIIKGRSNNVSCKKVKLPLKKLVTVAGVSGAGKSSLVHGIIAETINSGKGGKTAWSLGENELESSLPIERVVFIDQKPIGINSRSTPASYLGVWDEIRKVFANTMEAKSRGWNAGYFSYNTGKGRCSNCNGLGQIKLEMSFLPDALMLCDQCRGTRYEQDTKSVHYQGLSISDVLELTFTQARPVFSNHRKIHQALLQACEIGLGYLTLGQSSVTLSGGESQRIKLVSELSTPRKNHTLFILDEPTTGLHEADVAKLIKVLDQLVAFGHSVIVIEHDERFIAQSSHVIELGPGAGENGGRIIFQGAPGDLLNADTPWGRILSRGGAVTAMQASEHDLHSAL